MEKYQMGNNIEVITADSGCTVMKMKNEDGIGVMTFYKVFDGIDIIYNDFHMKSCKSEFIPETPMFCVDHCREGSIEQEVKAGVFRYSRAGDLKIDDRVSHNTDFYFPLAHYHGISICFEVPKADKSIKSVFPDFPVSIADLRDKYCKDNNNFFLRGELGVNHIFSELYNVPKKIQDYYFKIKVIELLLYLWGLEIGDKQEERPYFYKSQTEKIKAIQELITEDLQRHYTLDELAQKYDISLTGMKTCFKAVFGDSIYSFMRTYRMNRAATLLSTTDKSVATIANEVGYDSPSKFASAFRQEINLLPLQYRKQIQRS